MSSTAAPVRWGVIGTGAIAASFAADLERTDSGVVVAVGSRRPDTAHAFGERFGIERRHGSYEALVNDAGVDVIYVATPHPMHHSNSLLALGAGKPVLVEKAFALNAAEAREMVAAARAAGLFLMEGMWTRFLPHITEVRRLLAEGVLGELVTVIADFGAWFPRDPRSRLFAPELGGSALLDLGVYVVSFASMVLGPPETVVSLVEPAMTGVDGQTSMLFGYANGAHAVLTCTSSASSARRATIVGTDARVEIDEGFNAPASLTVVTRSGDRTRFEVAHEGIGLRHEADEVARCLRAGNLESPVMPLDETVSIMETMDTVLAVGRPGSADRDGGGSA
jgi:predicted dehydrogenase